VVCQFCRYNQIDKHLHNIKLCNKLSLVSSNMVIYCVFKEAAYEKTNVCELRVSEICYVMYLLYCFWFTFFIHVLILYAS
jgi:hypothetical protein